MSVVRPRPTFPSVGTKEVRRSWEISKKQGSPQGRNAPSPPLGSVHTAESSVLHLEVGPDFRGRFLWDSTGKKCWWRRGIGGRRRLQALPRASVYHVVDRSGWMAPAPEAWVAEPTVSCMWVGPCSPVPGQPLPLRTPLHRRPPHCLVGMATASWLVLRRPAESPAQLRM